MAVLLGLSAAAFFGVSSVLMHSKAFGAPSERSLHPGLLTHLVREPAWLAGAVAQLVGFGLQATALAVGSLVLVQVVGPTSLLVALPLARRTPRRSMRRSEWLGAAATVAGVATALALADPAAGRPVPTTQAWLVLFAVALPTVGGLVVVGRHSVGPARAIALATAAGVTLATTAAITKVTAARFTHGVGSGAASWEPYALAALGLLGILLMQSSFQAGAIEWSLPTLTVTNPLVSVVVGAIAFHETVTVHGPAVAALIASLAASVTGVFLLARSPALTALHRQAGP